MQTENPHQRRITLSSGPPVLIDTEEWPDIVRVPVPGRIGDHWLPYNPQAQLRVREHADGRRLVYGTCKRSLGPVARAGMLVSPEDDVSAAIRETAEALRLRVPECSSLLARLADEAIAALPAVTI